MEDKVNEAMDNITEKITGRDVIDMFDAEEAIMDDYDEYYDPRGAFEAQEGEVDCPECNSKNTVLYYKGNGPDDYVTHLECKDCGFESDD